MDLLSSFSESIEQFNSYLSNVEYTDITEQEIQKIEHIFEQLENCKKNINEFKSQSRPFVFAFTDPIPAFSCRGYFNSIKKSYLEEKNKVTNPSILERKNITKEYVTKKIYDVDLGDNILRLPIIEDIKSMPPSLWWYNGDKFHKKGIYTSLCDGFYVKVPFPNLVSGSESKIKTIRCKHRTFDDCKLNRRLSFKGDETKKCNFVHHGEKFIKLGFWARCELERFGNHETLNQDLDIITNFDIKHILMYSLSDILLSLLWYQNKFKNSKDLLLSGLDIFQ